MTTRAARLPSSMRGVLLGLILVALPAPCLSAGVALLTDLQGKATEVSGGQRLDLKILAELQAGTQVQLAAGATLVALYLDAGDEYLFKGPATIVFRPTQPDVVSGAKPEKRGPPLGALGKDIRIKPVGVVQGDRKSVV